MHNYSLIQHDSPTIKIIRHKRPRWSTGGRDKNMIIDSNSFKWSILMRKCVYKCWNVDLAPNMSAILSKTWYLAKIGHKKAPVIPCWENENLKIDRKGHKGSSLMSKCGYWRSNGDLTHPFCQKHDILLKSGTKSPLEPPLGEVKIWKLIQTVIKVISCWASVVIGVPMAI